MKGNLHFSLLIACSLYSISESAQFTRVPPSVLYVLSGGNATFEWDYSVTDRENTFSTSSPRWSFYTTSNDEQIIAVEDYFDPEKWKWKINSATCPARLLNPTRVRKEAKATLVISNVTNADSGVYGCTLVLQDVSKSITNKVELIVPVPPTFSPHYPKRKYNFIEGKRMKIICTAKGSPTPNITWVRIIDGRDAAIIISKLESAVLNISNVNRSSAGIYECQASNNPLTSVNTIQTTVTIYYPPEINKTATLDVLGCIGREVRLFCKASGSPKPSMTWIDPNDKERFINVSSPLFKLKDSSAFGNYTCNVRNYLGNDSYVISLTEGACTTPTPKTDVPAGIIAGVVIAGMLAIAGLIIALFFCYRRKSLDRDSFRSGAQQERTVQMSSLRNQEEQYASVQHQQDRGSSTEPIPQYALVDKNKNKKHNPDGLIYADLDLDAMDNLERRPSSDGHPTIEAGSTVYADIAGDKKHHPEPQYGNLHAKDLPM